MSVITTVPWHVYLTMFTFAVTIGVLVAIELRDLYPTRTHVHVRRPVSRVRPVLRSMKEAS